MNPSGNGKGGFTISFSGVIAQQIRSLQRRATHQGQGKDFLAALRKAIDRLRRDPRTFGEPHYRLPALRLQIRCAVIRPLVVYFAVSEDRPEVFLKGIKLL